MNEYIERDMVLSHKWKVRSYDPSDPDPVTEVVSVSSIMQIPAADVAPVRRGRWIKDGEDGPVYCSECGEEHEWGDYRATYCDTCGAKMDRGQGDE